MSLRADDRILSGMNNTRAGLTLIEVVISILLLAVGALALESSSALMVRRLAESKRASTAHNVARARSESSQSKECDALTSGTEQTLGVQSQWMVGANASSAEISQHVTYPTRRGTHTEKFLSAQLCE
jgi:prepilin-type N-terminal cleavage/methylation domain-containing protein